MNGYFGLGMRWKLTELHFWSVMLGNTVLFIASRMSVDFLSCITSRDGSKVTFLLNLRGDDRASFVEKDSEVKRFLSSQQKFIKSQDANKVQRTACWGGAGEFVCLGRHRAWREVEWSCRHYFMLKTAAVTTHPLLEDQGACSAPHSYNRRVEKNQPPSSPSWSWISLAQDSHCVHNFISLPFTGEQEMQGGQLIPLQGGNKLHLFLDKRFNPRWNQISLKLLLCSQITSLLSQDTAS